MSVFLNKNEHNIKQRGHRNSAMMCTVQSSALNWCDDDRCCCHHVRVSNTYHVPWDFVRDDGDYLKEIAKMSSTILAFNQQHEESTEECDYIYISTHNIDDIQEHDLDFEIDVSKKYDNAIKHDEHEHENEQAHECNSNNMDHHKFMYT